MQTIATSVEGRPIEAQSMGQRGPIVLFIASIHGDEPAGTPLLQRLRTELSANPQWAADRRLVFIDVTNPDGFAARTRENVHGVDLNRNFPAGNFAASAEHGAAPISEPESAGLRSFIDELKPDRIVTIHQPLKCIDYDGPAAELAKAMGRHTDLPVKRLGSRPGSLGSYAGLVKNTPIITLELPENATHQTADELWQRYGMALVAAITYPDPPSAAR
jgi:protein MpaA